MTATGEPRDDVEAGPGIRERTRAGDEHVYRVFGGRLASDVELEGLTEDPNDESDPDWRLCRESGPCPAGAMAETVAEHRVRGDVRLRLQRLDGDLRLAYEDTGTFDVSEDGSRISWYPGAEAEMAIVRVDILGRVLPLALHQQGLLCLHASAVRTGQGAVAFLGPKGAGKSTLAMSLSSMGAEVLTDDVLPVDPGPPPVVRAGRRRLRIRPDVARAAGRGDAGSLQEEGRVVIEPETPAGSSSIARLGAAYLLDPVDGESGRRVACERIPGPDAAVTLLRELKLNPLLAPWRGPELLRACAALERTVPVFRLRVPRDLMRLEEPGRFILGAHGGTGRAAVGSRRD